MTTPFISIEIRTDGDQFKAELQIRFGKAYTEVSAHTLNLLLVKLAKSLQGESQWKPSEVDLLQEKIKIQQELKLQLDKTQITST